MGIYKPQSQFMIPNNSTINNGVDNQFITKVSGEYCSGYIWQMPTLGSLTVPNVNLNKLIKLTTPLYNDDNLILTLPQNSFSGASLKKFLNYSMFWNITLLGKPKTITANTTVLNGTIKESVITITNGNFQNGDYVYLEQDSSPAGNFYYIGVKSDLTCKLYDTREKAMAMLATAEYHGVHFTDGTLVGKNIYVCAKSNDIAFKIFNKGTFSLTPSTITKFYNTFVPTYTQENDVAINNYQATLYNSDDEIISQSDIIYSSDVKMYVDGLFSGETYYVRFTAIDDIGFQYDTNKIPYNVLYKQPNINAPLIATNTCNDTTINLEWEYLISIHGELNCGDYVPNFMWDDNMGLELCPEAVLLYELDDIPIDISEQIDGSVNGSLPNFVWQPKSTLWVGTIMKVTNRTTGDYVAIGYDGSCITLTVNGMTTRTQTFAIEVDTITKKCYTYLIALRGKQTAVHKFMSYDIPLKTTIEYYSNIKTTSTTAIMAVNVNSFVGVVRYEYYLNGNKVSELNTDRITDFYEITGLAKMTKYETYVIVVDKLGYRIKSNTVQIETLSGLPTIKSISMSSVGKTYAKLHVNTASDNPIIVYDLRYNNMFLAQPSEVFDLNGLEENTTCVTRFIAYDSLLQQSKEYIYSFKTVSKELTIKSTVLSKISEYGVTVTVKYVAQAGIDRFEWLINGALVNTSVSSFYQITGLKPKVDYILNVRLIDLDGTQVISEDIPFTTVSLAPIINDVTVTNITNNSATFDVDADAQNGIATYDVIDNK